MKSCSVRVSAAEHGWRMDQALTCLLSELSRKQIKAIIDAGGAFKNKKRIMRAGEVVRSGDLLELFWQDSPRASQVEALTAGDIVFQNDQFVVIHKPAGMPSQATLQGTAGTVLEAVSRGLGIDPVFLVHRLDKETSGLLILAKDPAARAAFEDMFRNRVVKKIYLALVAGRPQKDKGRIEAPIVRDSLGHNRYRIASHHQRTKPHVNAKGQSKSKSETQRAQSAATEYRVLETSLASGSPVSLVAFLPETGRTHQIRVHAAQVLGCPLLGDKTYGAQVLGHSMQRGGPALRHMLHAWKLKFPDPRSGLWHSIVASPPLDFLDCAKAAGLTFETLGQLAAESEAGGGGAAP